LNFLEFLKQTTRYYSKFRKFSGGGDGDGNPLKSVWEVQGEANLIYQTENRFYAKRKSKEDKERYANKSEC